MTPDPADTVVEQQPYVVPDFTVKELFDTIPKHCFQRSALRSSLYIVNDVVIIAASYWLATYLDTFINPETLDLPHPALYTALYVANWALYSFFAGLFGTGIWVIAHECGHQAFSESKFINNSVGWVLHSFVGVPYHSWRISHAKHHAATCHMTQDQVYIPATRSEKGLPPLDPLKQDRLGSRVSEEVKQELFEALGDSPIGATLGTIKYLVLGWHAYIFMNAAGQPRYPRWTNHFNPNAVIFKPHQRFDVLLSGFGIALQFLGIGASIYHFGFASTFRVYLAPYMWVNHWLILITFLQHTDPLLPHYRAPAFTFPRGALSTMDRNLLGDLGPVMGWLGAFATHGISETHVAHHVASKIPHYNAWEASTALKAKLSKAGMQLEGAPGGWREMYRVYRQCKFVEDEGDVVFYKDAYGLAKARPVFNDVTASDSGVDVDGK